MEGFVKAPCVPPVLVNIFNKKEVFKKAKNEDLQRHVVFMDGSARKNTISIGIK